MANTQFTPKVLFLITKSNWGGAQAYVYALATALKDQNIPVSVACGGSGISSGRLGLLAERLKEHHIPVHALESLMRDVSFRQEVLACKEIFLLLQRERPDVLHLNSSKAGGLGALIGRLTGVPRIVYTAHGWPHREPRSVLSRISIWLASWITVALAHEVIAVSEIDYRDAPILLSRKKIRTIHNGVAPFPLYSQEEARAILVRQDPRLTQYSQWILMQAELHKNKGVDIAIEALAALDSGQTALVVLGEGEERQGLVELAKRLNVSDRVFLLGFIPDSKRFLAAATVIAFPSRKEGLPIALLESGIAQQAVIASATGGIPEVILDSSNGLLIPTENAHALAACLRSILADRDYAASLGLELKKTIIDRFSETQMISKTFAAYR